MMGAVSIIHKDALMITGLSRIIVFIKVENKKERKFKVLKNNF